MAGELLSAAGADAIRRAVAAAEAESGAEIVPVVAPASDDYRSATWAGVAAGALGGAALAALPVDGLRIAGGWAPAALAFAGALVGCLLAEVPRLRRRLAGSAALGLRVEQAAGREFLRHELFRTRDRTGVLIYVSLFERRVSVLADEGVYRAVAQEKWDELARAVAAGMKSRPAELVLLEAVSSAGALVKEFGPRRRSDDANELPDAPRAAT